MRLKINGQFFDFFNDVNINRKFDSVASTFSFNARYNPDNPEHRRIFKPGQYQTIEIFEDDRLLFTGTVVNTEFTSGPLPSLVKLSGYSLAGILEDCNIPVSAYPLESINRSLRDIVTRLLNVFNIGLVIQNTQVLPTSRTRTLTRAVTVNPINSFDQSIEGINVAFGGQLVTQEQVTVQENINEVDIIYPKSVAEPTESIKNYISKLCSQRNIVLSHNERGDVVLLKPDLNNVRYGFNDQNTLAMRLTFSGQGLHSDISVLRQPSDDNQGVSTVDTAKNPIIDQFRPKVKTLSSGEDTDVTRAADNELAAELKAISVKVSVNTILDLNPGDVVDVINERIFLFNRTKFIIKDISIKTNNESSVMDIMLVLPETYTAETPRNIFN